MSATLTTKRKSARDRPASGKERVGDGGRESGGHSLPRQRCSWSEDPRAIGFVLTLPEQGSAGSSCLACPARSCCILPLLLRLLALRPLPWRPLLLDAPVRTLHRHVITGMFSSPSIASSSWSPSASCAALAALCSRPQALSRPSTPPSPSCARRPSLPPQPASSSTHTTHSTGTSLCCTRSASRASASASAPMQSPIIASCSSPGASARDPSTSAPASLGSPVNSSSISSPHAAHLAARSLGLSAIDASDQLGRRTASSSSSPPSPSSCDHLYLTSLDLT